MGGMFEPLPDGSKVGPNIAKRYEWSEDLKTFTIYLREGAKWSNGTPFTADDITFQFNDVYGNDELTPAQPSAWSPGGTLLQAVKVDDYTVQLKSQVPNPLMEAQLWSYLAWQYFFYQPMEYVKKWHITYNAEANDLAKEEGHENWTQAFQFHSHLFPQQDDIDLPKMGPFVMKQMTTTTLLFERNPYYWKVDTEGNQLPYIDQIQSTIVDPEVYQLKVINGEADIAYGNLSLTNYPLYKENEQKGNYNVLLMPGGTGSTLSVGFNFNDKDPVLRKIYHDIRFRQALSVAIDRDEINESVFFGRAVPRNVSPLPSTSYYKEEWSQYYTQHDPDLANRLLDEMGLRKGSDGIRLRSDGKKLELLIEYFQRQPTYTDELELIKEYWENVGVKLDLRSMARDLFSEKGRSSDRGGLLAWARGRGSETAAYSMPDIDWFHGGELSFFRDWQTAIESGMDGSQYDMPGDVLTFAEVKEHHDKIRLWQTTAMGTPEYKRLAAEIFDYFTTQLWCIGTVGIPPNVFIAAKSIQNIGLEGEDFVTPGNEAAGFLEQWSLEQ